MRVLIEGSGDGISVGRSYRDAPEIDGLVLFDEVLRESGLVDAVVTGALTHDLIAKKEIKNRPFLVDASRKSTSSGVDFV